MSLAILDARVLTMRGDGVASPSSEGLGVLPRASVLVESGRISRIEPGDDGARAVLAAEPRTVIDARGRVLMPGFVDAHTHACWAGDRLDEWLYQRRGRSYLDVLRSGGGIMSTVRAVRAASVETLAADLRRRLHRMLDDGSTTVEVKSGYGLSTEAELKMLRAIADVASTFPGTVVPTALLGHALDPDHPDGPEAFVDDTIAKTLPAVSRAYPGITIDAYCESGAWSVEQCVRLFEAASKLGHGFRVHADQFNALGMVERAIGLGARSVDHLEASTPESLARLALSPATYGVVLPVCGLHVDDRYADARAFLDASPQARLVIATNFNPGSAPCGSMPLAIALAVRKCGLWPHEAIRAATAAPADLLGLSDRGRIEPGLRADLVLLRHTDERALAYELGFRHADAVVCGGRVVTADQAPKA
ncbi:MAG: imidazolonepropionase [Phycisphaerales bacterium]